MAFIFDPIRKKNVQDTPEERVRQYVISVLTKIKNVPTHLIEVEFSLSTLQPENQDRIDLMVTDLNRGPNRPWLLVECKAENQYTFERLEAQVNRYLKVLQPKYILLALGNACKIYSYLEDTREFKPITDIPNYR